MSTVNPDESYIVVASVTYMHMMSEMELSTKDLETVKVSRLPTTLITANGSTTEEATVYVRDLDMFVSVQLLDDSPAVLLLETLCEENGFI